MSTSNTLLVACLLAMSGHAAAQQNGFGYRRPVMGVQQEGWHSVELPAELFGRLNRHFTDVRLYTLGATDTLEVPYLLSILQDDIVQQQFTLPVINPAKRAGKQYLTFETTTGQTVNRIDLAFREKNFHALADVEGSNDQQTWYAIASGLRIVAIQNEAINYRYTSLTFADSRFRFLRIAVTPDVPLTPGPATITHERIKAGTYKTVGARWRVRQNEANQTIVTVKLDYKVPVSRLIVGVKNNRDFYRSFSIDGVRDSVHAQTGWIKSYEPLYDGFLTSLRNDAFNFTWLPVQELTLTIDNRDNPPLDIERIEAWYPAVELTAQLGPGTHYLFYGNEQVAKPAYDLIYFEEKIPADRPRARLGAEEGIAAAQPVASPLVTSKLWLWVILLATVSVLGYFTFRMMSRSQGVK